VALAGASFPHCEDLFRLQIVDERVESGVFGDNVKEGGRVGGRQLTDEEGDMAVKGVRSMARDFIFVLNLERRKPGISRACRSPREILRCAQDDRRRFLLRSMHLSACRLLATGLKMDGVKPSLRSALPNQEPRTKNQERIPSPL
jgi:hypothetical protein